MTDTRAWWSGRWFVVGMLALAAVPLLWPTIPPLNDLPGHMASYAVAIAPETSPLRHRYYTFEWHVIGNLGVDLLMVPLGRVFGVEPATRLVVTLIPVLTVAGMLLTARAAHGRIPPTAAFALPLAYNYFFLFGFVNYALAMALALIALALWIALVERPVLRALLFVAIAPALWVTHAIGWALLAIMCGAAELCLQWQRRRPLAAIVATALACLPLLAALVPMALQPPGEPAGIDEWLNLKELAKWILALFRDRWMTFDIACAAVALAVVGIASARKLGLRMSPVLSAAGAALLVAYVLVPGSLGGGSFINQRILPYAAALLLLAIDTRDVRSRAAAGWAIAATAFFLARIAAATASAAVYDAEWRSKLAALDHITPGGAVATFSTMHCSGSLSGWAASRTNHLPAMATVRREAFVNSLWTLGGIQLLRTRYAEAGAFQSEPSQIVTTERCPYGTDRTFATTFAKLPLDSFDHVWLMNVPRDQWPRDPRLRRQWSAGGSILYRVVPATASAR